MPETEATSTASEKRPPADGEPRDSGTMPVDPTAASRVDDMPGGPAPSLVRLRIGILLAMLLSGVAVAALPTYQWWHGRQSKFYDDACESAAVAESWEHLKAIATQWVEWDPKSSKGWIHLADAHLKLSELQEAVDALARVDNSYSIALEMLEVRGDLLFSELNQPYEAVKNWQRMLEIDERSHVARQRLIYFYAITMQRELMRAEIFRALELHTEPLEAFAYLLLAYDVTFSDGLRLNRQWLATYPDDETLQVAAAVYLANFDEREQASEFAISSVAPGDQSEVDKCLKTYPHNLEILTFHLEIAVFAGDEERVIELLGLCPPEAEKDCRFWKYRGWVLSQQGRWEEAAESLRTCIDLNPYEWRGRLLLSGALRQLGQNEEAAFHAELQRIGKDLQQELMTRPNASSIDVGLLTRIYEYVQQAGPPVAADSLIRRLEMSNPLNGNGLQAGSPN